MGIGGNRVVLKGTSRGIGRREERDPGNIPLSLWSVYVVNLWASQTHYVKS